MEDILLKRDKVHLKREDILLRRKKVHLKREDILLRRKKVHLKKEDILLRRKKVHLKRENILRRRKKVHLKREDILLRRKKVHLKREDILLERKKAIQIYSKRNCAFMPKRPYLNYEHPGKLETKIENILIGLIRIPNGFVWQNQLRPKNLMQVYLYRDYSR